MGFRQLILVLFLVGVTFLFGCGDSGEPADATSELAVQVEDWTMTKEHLEEVIANLPANQKKKYDSPTGRVKLADMFIEDELLYREGLRLKVDEDEEAKKAIEDAVKRIVIAEFYKLHIEKRARPTEEEIHEYYELHQDEFTSKEVVRAYHFFTKDKDTAYEMRKRIDEGEAFTTLVHKYSEDELTKPDGGDLGYFNPGGYIRFIGYSQKFSDAVFALEPNKISDPIEWERGWSIVRVPERRPEMLKPYDEAKEQIIKILTNRELDYAKAEILSEIKERYDFHNYMKDVLTAEHRTPEEIWNLAQSTTNSQERLILYHEIVQRFPDSDYTAQALFMVGFVYAEELKDFAGADRAFTQVIKNYPGSDVAKSAKWMLDNLNKPLPDFEDLDELHRKISEDVEGDTEK